MHQGIETAKLIDAIVRSVPGSYVRDYRESGGYLTVCRGYKTIRNESDGSNHVFPAELLCNLTPGWTPRPTLMLGSRPLYPGWQQELRKLGRVITAKQRGRIIARLRRPDLFAYWWRG